MKQILRAAGVGFGATLGAGAALVTTGALVAILARAGVRKSIDDLTVKIGEIVDQAAANLAEPPDQTRPEPESETYCGETFPGGQGACKLLKGHPEPHSSVIRTPDTQPGPERYDPTVDDLADYQVCTCPTEHVGEHLLTCPMAISKVD